MKEENTTVNIEGNCTIDFYMIRCKDCKHWNPECKEVDQFFAESNELRRQNHPFGVGLCSRDYPPVRPAAADEAFGWNLETDLASDIFTGPEHGCVRGEK